MNDDTLDNIEEALRECRDYLWHWRDDHMVSSFRARLTAMIEEVDQARPPWTGDSVEGLER